MKNCEISKEFQSNAKIQNIQILLAYPVYADSKFLQGAQTNFIVSYTLKFRTQNRLSGLENGDILKGFRNSAKIQSLSILLSRPVYACYSISNDPDQMFTLKVQ